jgi:hypothetical protein
MGFGGGFHPEGITPSPLIPLPIKGRGNREARFSFLQDLLEISVSVNLKAAERRRSPKRCAAT